MSPPPGFWHNHTEPCGVEGCKGMPALTLDDLQTAARNLRVTLTGPLVLEEPIDFVSPEEYLLRLREAMKEPRHVNLGRCPYPGQEHLRDDGCAACQETPEEP